MKHERPPLHCMEFYLIHLLDCIWQMQSLWRSWSDLAWRTHLECALRVYFRLWNETGRWPRSGGDGSTAAPVPRTGPGPLPSMQLLPEPRPALFSCHGSRCPLCSLGFSAPAWLLGASLGAPCGHCVDVMLNMFSMAGICRGRNCWSVNSRLDQTHRLVQSPECQANESISN